MANELSWQIEGSYYEACNCAAICPCRRQNGVRGGRSTDGFCDFLLSWNILTGHAGPIDLSGLALCLAGNYNDDVDGQPWSVIIYVDERADKQQAEALSDIFQGKYGGNNAFTGEIAEVLAIRAAMIELDHTAGSERIKIAEIGGADVVKPVDFDGIVSCGIPGHDHPGRENISSIHLKDGPFDWAYDERCGFSTDFKYWN